MKKFLFVIIFLMITFDSHAQSNWIYVATNSLEDDYFVETASVQKQGDSITFWFRTNFKERHKTGVLSSKIQKTFNCRTREHIDRYAMFYDDLNNNGRVTISFKPGDASWEPVVPDTVLWSVYKFVCK